MELAPDKDEESAREQPFDILPRVDSTEFMEINFNQPESLCLGLDDNLIADEVLEMGDNLTVGDDPVPVDTPLVEESSWMGGDRALSPGPSGEGSVQSKEDLEVSPEQVDGTGVVDIPQKVNVLELNEDIIVSPELDYEDYMIPAEFFDMAGIEDISPAPQLDEEEGQEIASETDEEQVMNSTPGLEDKIYKSIFETGSEHKVSSSLSLIDYQRPEEFLEMKRDLAMTVGPHMYNESSGQDLKIDDEQVPNITLGSTDIQKPGYFEVEDVRVISLGASNDNERPGHSMDENGDQVLSLGPEPEDNQKQELDLKIDGDQLVIQDQGPDNYLGPEEEPKINDDQAVRSGSDPDSPRPMEELKTDGEETMNTDLRARSKPRSWKPYLGNIKSGESNILNFSFPRRLWMVVEDEAFPCIHWNDEGDTVVIEEDEFQREVLQRGEEGKVFETDSIKTFIRLLNMHGFRKTRSKITSAYTPQSKKIMLYHNAKFKRDNPLLVESIQKKGNVNLASCSETTEPTPKRKKQVAATRRSPRFHHGRSTETTKEKALQGSRHPQPFPSPEVCSVSSTAECSRENYSLSEEGGGCGEGTSRNTFFPLAMTSRQRSRHGSNTSQAFTDYESVLSLYNTCYSILLATLSAMTPQQVPEAAQNNTDQNPFSSDQFEENPEA